MATGYLRYPHIHGDLITFVAGDHVWLSDTSGGRAWRLSADGTQVSYPRFSRDGTSIAWTSWRDGNPEVYAAATDGGDATRLTFWGDPQTRVTGWTAGGEVLVVTSAGQQAMKYRRAFAVPGHGDAPPRLLPFGPVNDPALEDAGTSYTAIIALIACGVVVYVIRMAARLRSLAWTIGLGLLLGGAAGNLADRLFRAPGPLRGSVVDWLNLPHVAWTFNLADAAITCAAVLIGILVVFGVGIDARHRWATEAP
jgi:hypothetical protein